MIVNKDEVLQAIKKLADDSGYNLRNSGGPYPPRKHSETLYLAAQPKEGDERLMLNFVVSWSYRFSITFAEEDISKHCKDLDELLIVIGEWLLNRKD